MSSMGMAPSSTSLPSTMAPVSIGQDGFALFQFPQLQLDGNVLRDAEVQGPGGGRGWRAGRCRESSPCGQRKRFWLQGGPPWLPDHAGGN
jgi:hypothetical protein